MAENSRACMDSRWDGFDLPVQLSSLYFERMKQEIKDKLADVQADLSDTAQMLGDMRADVDHCVDMLLEIQAETFHKRNNEEMLFAVATCISLIVFSFLFKVSLRFKN